MVRWDFLNYLAQKHNYKSYLEIGVRNPGQCLNKIKVAHKVGVDPEPRSKQDNIRLQTSDEFFETNTEFFDLIFIDGMHEHLFARRDIDNSLNFLNPGGTIVLHDCSPAKEFYAVSYEEWKARGFRGGWNGTVWKAIVEKRNREDLFICTVNTDMGLGIVRPGMPDSILTVPEEEFTYSNLEKNRCMWLNLISLETAKIHL